MGIFSYFKKMFNKNIENDEMYDNELVHIYSRRPSTFEIGYNIVVRPGFCAVFVARDKVTDVLSSGKYRIGIESLPLTFKRLKIDRTRNGKYPSKFKADLYFVNLNIFKDLTFFSNIPYVKKSKSAGRVTAFSEGTFNAQVSEAGDFVSYLLLDRAYINNKLTLEILGNNIGNSINKILEKSDIEVEDIFKNPKNAQQYLVENIANNIADMGIDIKDIQLKYFNITTRVKQKIDESIESEKNFVEQYKEFRQNDINDFDIDPQKFVVENNTQELTSQFQPVEYSVQKDTAPKPMPSEQQLARDISTINCPNCNQTINANSNFCQFCGFKVDAL